MGPHTPGCHPTRNDLEWIILEITYRIRDWDRHFENASSRKLKRLDWIALPNKMDGEGYTALVDHPNGAAHFGAWVAIVEIASKQTPRGSLPVGGISQDVGRICQSLGRISRLPARLFEEVLPRLVEIGWIEQLQSNQQSATTLGESADALGESANTSAKSGSTLQGTTGQGTTWNRKTANGNCARALDASIQIDLWAQRFYERHPKKKDMVLVQGALYHALDESSNPRALLEEIDRVHALWCQEFVWLEQNGRFAPKLAEWISDKGWTQEPKPSISKEEYALDEYDRRMGKI